MASSEKVPRFTAQQYLALERKAQFKSEFCNGYIVAMAGTSRWHNLIAGNMHGEIRAQFKGRPCQVYISDLRVRVRPTGLYTYPDVVAVCGEARFEDEKLDTLLNPTTIVEVLSDSTEAYDRGGKFEHYRQIDSLCEYVLISQDKVLVERFVRQDGAWLLNDFRDLGDVVELPSIGCAVSLREIYEKVEFPANEDSGR